MPQFRVAARIYAWHLGVSSSRSAPARAARRPSPRRAVPLPPLPPSLIGEALLPATVAAIAGGLLGGFIATAWRAPIRDGSRPARPLPASVAAASVLAIVAVVGYGLQTSPQQGASATVELRGAASGEAQAAVRIDPPSAAADANWLNVTAWQGHGLRVDPLLAVDEDAGLYRTSGPIPTAGSWKSLIRIQKGDSIVGMPIYMPADRAIPAAEVPAKPLMTREFVPDSEILQREQLDGVPGWTKAAGYAVVGSIVAAIVLMLGWILTRLAATHAGGPPARGAERPARRRPLATGRAAGGRA